MLPHFTLARHRRLNGFRERVQQSQPRFYFPMDAAAGSTVELPMAMDPYAAGTSSYSGSGYTLGQAGFCIGGKSVAFGGSANPARLITSATGQAFSGTQSNQAPFSLMVAFNADASGHGAFACMLAKILYFAEFASDFPISLRWDATNSKVVFRLDSGGDFSADFDLSSTVLSTGTDYLVHAIYRNTGTNGVELWVNGVLNVRGTYTFTPATATGRAWTIGAATPYGGGTAGASAFKGRIGDAAMWNYALSQYQIEQQQAARTN